MQQATEIEFYGDTLLVVQDNENTWVSVRHICVALGISNQKQQLKLQNSPQFMCNPMVTHDTIGRQQEMFCIQLDQLNLWLAGINANRVKPEIRDRLITYQRECAEVLFKHFMPRGGTQEELAQTMGRLLDEHLLPFKQDLRNLREEMGERFIPLQQDIHNLHSNMDNRQQLIQQDIRSLRGEVDELRELIHIVLSDNEEKEIRGLIRRVKAHTGMDGRAVVGHVRGTLNTAGIYTPSNLAQVKNVLRNLLGLGIKGIVPQDSED